MDTFQHIRFDLTEQVAFPDKPWQGDIEAIRLDPVAELLGTFGDPDAGWLEIDHLVLR